MASGKNSVLSKFRKSVLRGENRKNCSFLYQSIENKNFYLIYKNELPRSIRREDMKIFLFFDLEKGLIHLYFPSKLR